MHFVFFQMGLRCTPLGACNSWYVMVIITFVILIVIERVVSMKMLAVVAQLYYVSPRDICRFKAAEIGGIQYTYIKSKSNSSYLYIMVSSVVLSTKWPHDWEFGRENCRTLSRLEVVLISHIIESRIYLQMARNFAC